MPLVVAIGLTILATIFVRIGIVLLKMAIGESPERPNVVGALIHSNAGRAGLALQALGYALFLLALSEPSAAISILQPVRTIGVLVTVVLGVTVLHERLDAREWGGVGLQTAGFVLLGCSLSATNATPTVHVSRLLVFTGLVALLVLVGFGVVFASRSGRLAEVAFGMLAGVLLGAAYLHAKVVFLARNDRQFVLGALSLAIASLGAVGGLAALLWSFRSCRATIVTTINFVINQTVVVVGGPLCLGELLPDAPIEMFARIGGIASILLGVVLLARFPQGRATTSLHVIDGPEHAPHSP